MAWTSPSVERRRSFFAKTTRASTTVITRTLTDQGYTVVSAKDGEEALTVAERGTHEFDLLLTDVIMPRLGAVTFPVALTERSPKLRTIFLSGYTDDVLSEQGLLEDGVELLKKPFRPSTLLREVRETLDR